jgi:nicotinamidase-related amidase
MLEKANPETTALVITDPQNHFLSPEGATWALVGASVQDNNTVENIDSLLKAAKQNGIPVSSPTLWSLPKRRFSQ